MISPIERMIDMAVKCTRCGARGFGNCACWPELTPGQAVTVQVTPKPAREKRVRVRPKKRLRVRKGGAP